MEPDLGLEGVRILKRRLGLLAGLEDLLPTFGQRLPARLRLAFASEQHQLDLGPRRVEASGLQARAEEQHVGVLG